MSTALICSLGTSAPVISETLNALYQKKEVHVDRLIVVHTASKDVSYKMTESGKEIGLEALKAFMKGNDGKENAYSNIEFIPEKLEFEDILTEEQNKVILRKMLEVIARERMGNEKVYVSIAGGRKTMSALLLVAAYLGECDGIFHVLVEGDERALTDKHGFEIPSEKLVLIETPFINLNPILQTVLSEIDPKNKYGGNFYNYLSDGQDINTVFDRCNRELQSSLVQRKLKEEYERCRERYQQMCNVVDSILRERAKEAGIMRPQQESRVKTLERFIEKIGRKQVEGKPVDKPFKDIEDIAGCRIICYFAEDVDKIRGIIKSERDFVLLEIVEIQSSSIKRTMIKSGKGNSGEPAIENKPIGYNATHFIVSLRPNRTRLPEFKNLVGVKCEIQVRTIFDHTWAQVDHRLRYKSNEFQQMNAEEKDVVNNIFAEANVYLSDTKKKFGKLRSCYKSLD